MLCNLAKRNGLGADVGDDGELGCAVFGDLVVDEKLFVVKSFDLKFAVDRTVLVLLAKGENALVEIPDGIFVLHCRLDVDGGVVGVDGVHGSCVEKPAYLPLVH